MTPEEILKVAHLAGLDWDEKYHWYVGDARLSLFAHLVEQRAAAAEREACAEIAENGLIGHTIAKAIRARSKP